MIDIVISRSEQDDIVADTSRNYVRVGVPEHIGTTASGGNVFRVLARQYGGDGPRTYSFVYYEGVDRNAKLHQVVDWKSPISDAFEFLPGSGVEFVWWRSTAANNEESVQPGDWSSGGKPMIDAGQFETAKEIVETATQGEPN